MRSGLSADGSNGAKACVLSQHHRYWTGAMAVSRAQWCPRQQWLVAWSQTVPSVFSAQCVLLPKRPRSSIHHRVSAFTLFRALTRFREQLRAVASTAAQHALPGCCLACFFVFSFFFCCFLPREEIMEERGNRGKGEWGKGGGKKRRDERRAEDRRRREKRKWDRMKKRDWKGRRDERKWEKRRRRRKSNKGDEEGGKKKATEKKGGDGKASFDNIAGGPAGRKLPPMLS